MKLAFRTGHYSVNERATPPKKGYKLVKNVCTTAVMAIEFVIQESELFGWWAKNVFHKFRNAVQGFGACSMFAETTKALACIVVLQKELFVENF